jgi:NADH dehydrogenase FAD-containing subunit
MSASSTQVLFAGAGHAHLYALARLADYLALGAKVTVVAPEPDILYTGMSPRLVSGTIVPRDMTIPARSLVESAGGIFIEDRVVSVDPERRVVHTKSSGEIPYDLASFATGSRVAPRGIKGTAHHALSLKPISRLKELHHRLTERLDAGERTDLVVIGGGAAGVEIACHVLALAWRYGSSPQLSVTLFEAKGHILGTFARRFGRKLYRHLTECGVTVRSGVQIAECTADEVVTTRGRRHPADIKILAAGPGLGSCYRRAGFASDVMGGLMVDETLQSVSHPGVFGAGDCVRLRGHKLPKTGVYAVREGPVLHRNLIASLKGAPLGRFRPQRRAMLIVNMADGRGALVRGRLVWCGRLALALKNRIDRKFVAGYQTPAADVDTSSRQ